MCFLFFWVFLWVGWGGGGGGSSLSFVCFLLSTTSSPSLWWWREGGGGGKGVRFFRVQLFVIGGGGYTQCKKVGGGECRYGIITTNRKSLYFQGGLSVCRLLFNSFSKLKIDENYKEKKEAVLLTTKFNSASGPALCLTAGCRGRFTFIGGRPFFHTHFREKGDPHGIKRNGKKSCSFKWRAIIRQRS